MSYDITIASDSSFSQFTAVEPLRTFLLQLPGIEPNGDYGFVLSENNGRWMEIDLEAVSEDGDTLDDTHSSAPVNCIRLHIPYHFLGESPQVDYFLTARAIAQHLGWLAIDEQTGETLGT